jgi:acyl transferase domain-containing protein
LYVGSIKTNIGHLEGASGIAGLIKAVLSVEKGVILPNLWFESGNPAIDFDGWRIRVPTEPSLWPTPGIRRASVNSFGYGGSNVHAIIDDAHNYLRLRGLKGKHWTVAQPTILTTQRLVNGFGNKQNGIEKEVLHESTQRPRIFPFAAHEKEAVIATARAYAQHLSSRIEKDEEMFLDNLAYTLGERRSRLPWGCFVIASSKSELEDRLNEKVLKPIRKLNGLPRLAFVFSGQGAQWWRMGRELLSYPVFSDAINAAEAALSKFGSSWSLLGKFTLPCQVRC